MKGTLLTLGALLGLVAGPSIASGQTSPKIAVTTYHYDNLRTGWNSQETTLNPSLTPPPALAAAGLTEFGLLRRVPLDDLVYAQPLLVPNVTIGGPNAVSARVVAGSIDARTHDIAYVVTENNTIYAIDAHTGAILLNRNLGPAVSPPPYSTPPANFTDPPYSNNGPRVGIESTPVIDMKNRVMYLIAYTAESQGPVYRLHAIDLATLNDTLPPVIVQACHTLADGNTVIKFNPYEHRQRAALLLANGIIYAAFTSWNDLSNSRGWLLGWQAPNLEPLKHNFLTNTLPADGTSATIWMSGYGVAADASGSIYFATGNSSPPSTHSVNNLSESVLKVSADLSALRGIFTPVDVNALDGSDRDFGSGGVLLLPDQPGMIPHMAIAAGKEGTMFLLDRDQMGNLNTATDNFIKLNPLNGGCWCGQSYFSNNVVTSAGDQIEVWPVPVLTLPSPQKPVYSSIDLDTSASSDPGFFTSVSSNGNANAMIWAVSRHNSADPSADHPPTLFAFSPTPGNLSGQPLFPAPSPSALVEAEQCWNFPSPADSRNSGLTFANSNIVPVVANGHVYVASYGQLAIYGFKRHSIWEDILRNEAARPACSPSGFSVSVAGVVANVKGSRLAIKTEAGAVVEVESEGAARRGVGRVMKAGQAIRVYGNIDDKEDLLHAALIKPDFHKKP